MAKLPGVGSDPSASTAIPTCGGADQLLHNGKILTLDRAQAVVHAMAIRDGKILAVGNDDALNACASPRTQLLDLRGRTVLPGLIDVHTHAMEWVKSILRGEINSSYPEVHSITEIARAVELRSRSLPPGQWILGSGWDDAKLTEHRYITRHDLDAVAPNHPVYLVHGSGHLGVVNSAGLELAGITRHTPDPSGGVIERDASGEPTGILKETALTSIAALLPKDPSDIYVQAAKLISEKAAEVGLTTIHDIFISSDEMRGYQEARQRGWL